MDVLHGDEVALLDLPEVEDLHDVRVGEAGHHLGLVHEHVQELLVVGEVGQDALDGQGLLEARRPAALGLEHLGHAPDRDAVDELVGPEHVVPPARLLARRGFGGDGLLGHRGQVEAVRRRPRRRLRDRGLELRARAGRHRRQVFVIVVLVVEGRELLELLGMDGAGRLAASPHRRGSGATTGSAGVLPPMGSRRSSSASTSAGRAPPGPASGHRRGPGLVDADLDGARLGVAGRPRSTGATAGASTMSPKMSSAVKRSSDFFSAAAGGLAFVSPCAS